MPMAADRCLALLPDPDCHRALLREYVESHGRNVAVIGSADAVRRRYTVQVPPRFP
jgi:hypothetical protein